MPAYGVYPVADAKDPGEEISSTYEGRHITLLESDLIHPTHADGFVDKGDPICSATGHPAIVGVAFKSAAAATDLIAIDTEGIWNLDVVAVDDAGNSAVAGGDCIYINTTTAVLSKISNGATQRPFGYALGIITGGATNAIAVKVHFDQAIINAKRDYYTVTSGAYTYGRHSTAVFAGGQSTGLEYHDQQVTGQQTNGIYGFGTWMELAAGFIASAHLLVAHEIGIYDAGGDLTLSRVVMQQIQGILASNPASLHIWRINIAAAGGTTTAIMAFANPTSAGWVAGAGTTGTKLGDIPLVDIVGVGVGYVRIYDSAV